eukprot:GILI01000437.1.p2 GENE.GILI01000437.1~~GILI01000437.1.p2  ORF type:complete len:142 (-),score=54.10 GILI01000437.1:71-496(-)
MGKIRTKTVKRASRVIVEKYFNKLGKDYYVNKRVVMDVTLMASKKLRNKVSGYTTCIMKRLARGPVRGISLKLQEEERERRMDFVPEVSAVNTETIEIDADTKEMLKELGLGSLPGVSVTQSTSEYKPRHQRERRERRERH